MSEAKHKPTTTIIHSRDFQKWVITWKANSRRAKINELHQAKKSLYGKGNQTKWKATNGIGKIFASHLSDNKLIGKIDKKHNSTGKKC